MLWNSPALKSTNFKSNLLSSINKVLSSSAKIRVQWAGQKDSKLTVVRLSALQIHLAFKSLQKCFTHQQSTLECVKADTTLPHLPPHFTYLYKDVKCNAIVSPSHRVNYGHFSVIWQQSELAGLTSQMMHSAVVLAQLGWRTCVVLNCVSGCISSLNSTVCT